MEKMNERNDNISDVIAPMMSITRELDAIIGTLLHKEFDMSLADFKILRAVFILDTCTQSDVSHFNQVTQAAVSKRIALLQKQKLIKKEVSKEDKRQSVLSLTLFGKKLMKRLQVAVIKNTELMLSDFSEKDRELTTTLLLKILSSILKHSPNSELLYKSKNPIMNKLSTCKK